jgi:hypothetical protein
LSAAARAEPQDKEDDMATTYEIHPAIGITRLAPGAAYFFAAEPDCQPADYDHGQSLANIRRAAPRDADGTLLTTYREQGELKRQAVRFRVFEVERDAAHAVTACRELHEPQATITWTVKIANRKGAARRFAGGGRRNAGKPESKLVIGPAEEQVTGVSRTRPPLAGQFKGKDVTLGNIATDDAGRLIVIADPGPSGAVPGTSALSEDTFADNDGWYDRTGDGPVTATIDFKNGRPAKLVDKPAWVIIAPFDFAPGIDSFVTLYDVARQAAVDRGWLTLPAPGTTDYPRNVLPILQRTRGYRWVNSWALQGENQGRHTSWRDAPTRDKIATPNDPDGRKWRLALLAHLRLPEGYTETTPRPKRQVLMPRLYGNDYAEDGDPDKVLALTHVQYRHFENWANDAFVNTNAPFEEFLGPALTRLALEACSGGPFWPGLEASRVMTDGAIYSEPFRFDPARLQPGDITAGLAVPWQADFYLCQMDGDNMWWPATHPDKVFREHPPKNPVDQQAEEMAHWDQGIADMQAMVKKWHRLGVVKRVEVDPAVAGADLGDENPPKRYAFIELERKL